MYGGIKLKFTVFFCLFFLLTYPIAAYQVSDQGYPLGLKLSSDFESKAPFLSDLDLAESVSLPDSFNWRDQYILPTVKNQGRCGSCVAFGVAGVVESLHRVAYGMFKDPDHSRSSLIDLSEQSLVSRCSSYGDCRGGYLTHFNYVKENGLPYEKTEPYLASNSSCKNNQGQLKVDAWGYVGARGRYPSIDEIKQALYKFGPLAVTINGNLPYRSGVFTSCGSTSQNHVVVLEGWVSDSKYASYGGGYWIIRNSWGSWGEKGFLRIAYRKKGTDTPCNGAAAVATWAILEDIGPIRDYIGHYN